MSTNEKKYLEKMINNYQEKAPTKVDELKQLDKKVKKPVNIFAYILGTVGALVLGFGMCVAMEVILPGLMWVGIIVGVVGILIVSGNYFLHKKMLQARKKKYASQIVELSKSLLNEETLVA